MIKNSNFGYFTYIDGENLEYWSNSDKVHYYEKDINTGKIKLKEKKRITEKVLDYKIQSDRDRITRLSKYLGKPNDIKAPYTFFDKYITSYYKPNINCNEDLSSDIDVFEMLEKYANYIIFAPDADPLCPKTEYTFITEKQSKEIARRERSYESMESEYLREHRELAKQKGGKYVKQEFKKFLNEQIDSQESMNFVEHNDNFYLLNNQKIYQKDLEDEEIGRYLKIINENIEKIKEYRNKRPEEKLNCDNLIKTLKMNAIDYKDGIKRPIEMKKLSKGNSDTEYLRCNYWDFKQIKELLRCPTKNLLTELGELVYDLDQLIKGTKFTDKQKQVLNLWRNTSVGLNETEEEQDLEIQKKIAKELNCSQQFISQSIDNIAKKISETYIDEYENWLNLNWINGTYKKCNKCEEIKLISKFGKDERNKDGLKSICKTCDSESKKE